MAPQKETQMVLKVDLDCNRCYTKVKRVLCCYPQIQDQIYNEKQNTVTIKVVCCTPEKIRDKILAKGGKSIKGIQIVEPKKPADKQSSKPKEAAQAEKLKEAAPTDKPKEGASKAAAPADAKPAEKMKKNGSKNGSKDGSSKPDSQAAKPQGDAPAKPKGDAPAKPQGDAPAKPKGDAPAKPKDAEAVPKPAEQAAAMVHMVPPELIQCYPGYPINAGCLECYEGRMCYHNNGYGFGAPPPPPPAGGWGYYGGAAPGGYGAGGYMPPVYRYGDYVSDENPTGCVVM